MMSAIVRSRGIFKTPKSSAKDVELTCEHGEPSLVEVTGYDAPSKECRFRPLFLQRACIVIHRPEVGVTAKLALEAISDPLKPRGWSGVIAADWMKDSFIAYLVGTGGSGPATLVIRVPPDSLEEARRRLEG